MLRFGLIFLLLTGLLLAAFAWSGNARADRADFTFVNRGEVGTLDPNRMSWVQDIRIGFGLWEGLYGLDPQTLEPIPGVARQVDITNHDTLYTFHLRNDARWSNGDQVIAADFVFAWRRMLEEPGDYTYLFYVIKGAQQYSEEFGAGKAADFATVGIKVKDDLTLEVELAHPVVYFPDLCAFSPFWPLHERSMRSFRDPKSHSYAKAFTRPPNLVTNGPYRLTVWNFRENLRLEANPYYWDRGNVKSRSIDILIGTDPMWSFLKYDSGAVDCLTDATGSIGSELYAQKRPDMHVFPGFGTYFYSLNCQEKLWDGRPNPFHDPRVRKAFALAVQRKPIVDTITRLGESTACSFIPPGVFAGYHSPDQPLEDVPKARELLAEAGYPQGKGFPQVSILFNGEFQHGDIAQYIRRQWLENLGVDVGLEQLEIKTFRENLKKRKYAVARASWSGDYNDVSTFLDYFRSNSENNDAGWINAEYDALMDEAAVEADAGKRLRLFERAEKLLIEGQPIIPIYHYVNACLFRGNVTGLYLNPRNTMMLKAIEVRR